MTRTPVEELEALAGELTQLAHRLRAADEGGAVFTRDDVDRIVSARLAREQKRTRRAEREIEELEAEIESLKSELLALS